MGRNEGAAVEKVKADTLRVSDFHQDSVESIKKWPLIAC